MEHGNSGSIPADAPLAQSIVNVAFDMAAENPEVNAAAVQTLQIFKIAEAIAALEHRVAALEGK